MTHRDFRSQPGEGARGEVENNGRKGIIVRLWWKAEKLGSFFSLKFLTIKSIKNKGWKICSRTTHSSSTYYLYHHARYIFVNRYVHIFCRSYLRVVGNVTLQHAFSKNKDFHLHSWSKKTCSLIWYPIHSQDSQIAFQICYSIFFWGGDWNPS